CVLYAGVIDQDVYTTQGLCRSMDEVARGTGLAEVGIDITRLDVELQFDIDAFLLDGLGVTKTVKHNIGAIGRQLARHGQTDAAGRTRNDRVFSIQHVIPYKGQ